MEQLVSLGKEVFQGVAEHAASYRLGQSALRHLDRSLWVVEKCARWAVPPPLDQDERPQPELVRPLPWVFFLVMLVALRVTRESISLLNLVMGKPPLRSADVVMYIQSKRRYLRTLKYQGNRMMRARTCSGRDPPSRPWYSAANSLLEFTMCFRRNSHYANNNTTHVSNNEQVLVVKRSKRGREQSSTGSSETTMERLIEKMMVDLDADSDDDSSFTLTNVTSAKSDRSDITTESDQETICQNNVRSQSDPETPFSPLTGPATSSTPQRSPEASRPEKTHLENSPKEQTDKKSPVKENSTKTSPEKTEENVQQKSSPSSSDKSNQSLPNDSDNSLQVSKENVPPRESTKDITNNFILNEAASSKIPRTPKTENKIANGRTVKSAPSKKKGTPMIEKERRTNSDAHVGTNHQGSPNNTL